MKRLSIILLVLFFLAGCGQTVITPSTIGEDAVPEQVESAYPTFTPSAEPFSPAPVGTPVSSLPSYEPKQGRESLFMEELLSLDGEPIDSEIRSLLQSEELSKSVFFDRFASIIQQVDALKENVVRLSGTGRTLTADRKEITVDSLTQMMADDRMADLQNAYARCSGEGEELPVAQYAASMSALLQAVQGTENRISTFFDLGADGAREYKAVLERYMGEPILPRAVLEALEDLAQTEAYAISAALQADPEAGRKKEPISFGSYAQNISFLCQITKELCPLPDGSDLPVPYANAREKDMDLLELAFRMYPGMAFLKEYSAQTSAEQQVRWANASDGYLAGLAVHCSYAVIPYLDDFGLDYVQYRWYEDMLDVTLTGISALLIHYYGYSETDLANYLKGWGAEDYASYLYEKAMSDPFESLIASYGYYRYLDICQAAMDAGCESESLFLREYLSAGPAPFEALKEYMVGLYQKQG